MVAKIYAPETPVFEMGNILKNKLRPLTEYLDPRNKRSPVQIFQIPAVIF